MAATTKQRLERHEQRLDQQDRELEGLLQDARRFVTKCRKGYNEARELRKEFSAILARQRNINRLLTGCPLGPALIGAATVRERPDDPRWATERNEDGVVGRAPSPAPDPLVLPLPRYACSESRCRKDWQGQRKRG